MSGGVETGKFNEYKDESGRVEEAMRLFKVSEKTAREILDWSLMLAQVKFDKWRSNYIRRVMRRVKKME